jgi:hypothetical protein
MIKSIINTAIRSVILFAAFWILHRFGMVGTGVGIFPILAAVGLAELVSSVGASLAKSMGVDLDNMTMTREPPPVKPGSTQDGNVANQTDVPGGALTTVGAQP